MHGTPPNTPRPMLIVIDGRGGTDDAEMAHWMRRKVASRLGIDSERIGLWSIEPWLDLWSLPAAEIAAALESLISKSEPPDGVI